nr:Na-translocating system protein MpsC family protein [Caldicellulosiruptor acetigenus]
MHGQRTKADKNYNYRGFIVVRLIGFLSPTEKRLAQTKEGIELIKKVRATLFENAKEDLANLIKQVIDVDIAGIYSDVNTVNGEKVIVITLNKNLEKN